ncbi:hypothetical protein GETHPA_14960 [Geothrix rubra]|uniref:DUF5777 domain-containing protein n=1 Tax=Geothrix rubra TaxID=2927977 RepID=A0ABQ5Q5S3_9BACT|nr:DUF5777 family beta-barrel protein [Geothrix rubra]GLH69963.1 hypothetical protein GETHPA_14960 [Geothrix rubra]
MRLRTALALLCLASALAAQESEVPLGLNLPTAEGLQGWQPALRFTHRFTEPARGHSRDWYGLDGGNFPGLGLDLGIGAVRGLNAQVYRTADDKTVVLALQQQLLAGPHLRLAARVERFDEAVQQATYAFGSVGITGSALQLPVDLVAGSVTLGLVPTWLSRTTTRDQGLVTAGVDFRWRLTDSQMLLGEYYPRPARLAATYERGYAFGYRILTKGHRFTLLVTNVQGTTAHQVLGGDDAGGPRPPGQWALGFNLVRLF